MFYLYVGSALSIILISAGLIESVLIKGERKKEHSIRVFDKFTKQIKTNILHIIPLKLPMIV